MKCSVDEETLETMEEMAETWVLIIVKTSSARTLATSA
jgi:hypothetical protein